MDKQDNNSSSPIFGFVLPASLQGSRADPPAMQQIPRIPNDWLPLSRVTSDRVGKGVVTTERTGEPISPWLPYAHHVTHCPQHPSGVRDFGVPSRAHRSFSPFFATRERKKQKQGNCRLRDKFQNNFLSFNPNRSLAAFAEWALLKISERDLQTSEIGERHTVDKRKSL